MPIIKLHDDKTNKDLYFDWSEVVDAPVTRGMSLKNFKKYWKEKYGTSGLRSLTERLIRVELYGTSSYLYADVDTYIKHNRAGDDESTLSKTDIIDRYRDV